jgi:hypothetical protein
MRSSIAFGIALAAFGLAGCATMGMGVGSTPNGNVQANFTWQSTGGRTGQMTAQLNDGQTFTGDYFQITRDTSVYALGPLWTGWGPRFGFGRWGYWGPSDQFVTEYSGRVVGNLQAPNGTHMRCRFFLVYPSRGMAGGGQGQCQLPSGQMIDAMFPGA